MHFSIQAMFALYKKLKQNKIHSDYSQINRVIKKKGITENKTIFKLLLATKSYSYKLLGKNSQQTQMFKSHTNGPITYGVKKPRGTKVTKKKEEK